jgi:flagellar L-ring protein FlgH
MMVYRASRIGLSVLAATTLVACASNKPKLADAEFAPIVQIPEPPPVAATGSIYQTGRLGNWFDRRRDFKIGDIVTVIVIEAPSGSNKRSNNMERTTSNNVMPSVQPLLPGVFDGLPLNGTKHSTDSEANTSHGAELKAAVAATVTQVLSNGNLILRGEKQIEFSQGAEKIRVAGIARPDDITSESTIRSERLANAQISYTGSGDMENASKVPWGSGFLMKIWPF